MMSVATSAGRPLPSTSKRHAPGAGVAVDVAVAVPWDTGVTVDVAVEGAVALGVDVGVAVTAAVDVTVGVSVGN